MVASGIHRSGPCVIATNLVALGMLVRTLASPATEGTAQDTVREVAVGSAG